MTIKAKRKLNHLETKAARTQAKNILEGVDPHSCILSQFTFEERGEMRPHDLHAMIRRVQRARTDTLDDIFPRYDNDFVALTVPEQNFIFVYERDVRNGVLHAAVNDVLREVALILSEELEKAENED